jgi:SAM-dependent methyltransferase
MGNRSVRQEYANVPEEVSSKADYLLFLRQRFAYEYAAENIPAGGLVLEAGCGKGYGAHALSERGFRVVALNSDEKGTAQAAESYGSENCLFRTWQAPALPFDSETFDAVISFRVIGQMRDDSGFVAEIFRVLNPGGVLILTTPTRILYLKPGERPRFQKHGRQYRVEDLVKVLSRSFTEVRVWGIRGTEEIQRIANSRKWPGSGPAGSPKSMMRLLTLFLKRLFPASGDNIRVKKSREERDKSYLEKYSTQDFYIIKYNIENSLDLVGICKK